MPCTSLSILSEYIGVIFYLRCNLENCVMSIMIAVVKNSEMKVIIVQGALANLLHSALCMGQCLVWQSLPQ